MTNSADPDQLASSESTLFAKTGHVVFSKRRVKGEFLLWTQFACSVKSCLHENLIT